MLLWCLLSWLLQVSLDGFPFFFCAAVYCFEGAGMILSLEQSVPSHRRPHFKRYFICTIGCITTLYIRYQHDRNIDINPTCLTLFFYVSVLAPVATCHSGQRPETSLLSTSLQRNRDGLTLHCLSNCFSVSAFSFPTQLCYFQLPECYRGSMPVSYSHHSCINFSNVVL